MEGLRCCGGALGACSGLRQILPHYFRGVTSSGSEDTEIPEMQDFDTVTGVTGGGVNEIDDNSCCLCPDQKGIIPGVGPGPISMSPRSRLSGRLAQTEYRHGLFPRFGVSGEPRLSGNNYSILSRAHSLYQPR